MNSVLRSVAVVLALGACGAADASGAWTGRAGVLGGPYSFKDTFTDTGGFFSGTPGATFTTEDGDTNYGLLLGTTAAVGRFFADLGIEASQYAESDDFFRSDALLTVGAYLGDRWTAFAGYRHATFGDGVFSETDGNTETGPFLGGGVSFHPGEKFALGASLAFNFLKLSLDGETIDDVDLNGASVKVQGSFLGTPHSIFLRWQHFKGDTEEAGVYEYEYTEDYVNLGYQATFDFIAW